MYNVIHVSRQECAWNVNGHIPEFLNINTYDSITDLIATVGEMASSLAISARCFRLSAYPHPLMIQIPFLLWEYQIVQCRPLVGA